MTIFTVKDDVAGLTERESLLERLSPGLWVPAAASVLLLLPVSTDVRFYSARESWLSFFVFVRVLLRPLDSCTTTCAKIRVSGASGQQSPYPGSAHSVTRTAGDSRDGAKGHDNTTTAYTADMGTWVHGSEQTLQCHCKRAGEGSREMQAAG